MFWFVLIFDLFVKEDASSITVKVATGQTDGTIMMKIDWFRQDVIRW